MLFDNLELAVLKTAVKATNIKLKLLKHFPFPCHIFLFCFQLPKADLYFWEEFPAIMSKDPYVTAKISSLLLQSYLVALINQNSSTKQVLYYCRLICFLRFIKKFANISIQYFLLIVTQWSPHIVITIMLSFV